jgi:ATP-dependent HslUV protease, peptidase subunit HslV
VFKHIVRDYFGSHETAPKLDTVANIFRTWNRLHADFKERYFLQTDEEKEDAVESTRLDVLLANPHGIFGVSGQRTVQEFSKFYAFGSGADLAMGAMYAVYGDRRRSAEDVARLAVEAAAEFNDSTGLPVESHAVKLARR